MRPAEGHAWPEVAKGKVRVPPGFFPLPDRVCGFYTSGVFGLPDLHLYPGAHPSGGVARISRSPADQQWGRPVQTPVGPAEARRGAQGDIPHHRTPGRTNAFTVTVLESGGPSGTVNALRCAREPTIRIRGRTTRPTSPAPGFFRPAGGPPRCATASEKTVSTPGRSGCPHHGAL